jgi:hypothetical protein
MPVEPFGSHHHSRYVQSVRRTRREVLRASMLGSVGLLIASCGGKSATPTATIGDASPATVLPATVLPSTVVSAASPAPVGPGFKAAQQLRVSLSYVANGGGRINNPYIAVWVEDAQGVLVHTVGISVKLGKGLKWLRDLKSWYRSDQARISAGGTDTLETISSPTRQPGVHEYIWDGRNDAGELIAAGTYTLFIEGAREKGPYNIVEYSLVIDGSEFDSGLEPAGELQEIRVAIEPV